MIDRLCTRPLLELLRTAMDVGVINAWSVEDMHVILYRSRERHCVLPLEAGTVLRDWLEQAGTRFS